jgi:hypothetical protein
MAGLDDDFASRLARFTAAAPQPITIQSGYRDNQRQAGLWQQALQKYGSPAEARKWVAPPGHSMHNRGLAADLGYGGGGLGKGDAGLIDWAHKNASQYGMTFPLPNENWHIEPIGARGTPSAQPMVAGNADSPLSAPATTASAGPTPPGPADTHSLLSAFRSQNPIERQGMLSGLQDYSFNQYLADGFSGQNPLRRAFYGEISRILG